MRNIYLLFIFCFSTLAALAQELTCTVQVVAPKISGTAEKKIFESLQTSIFEFMNNTKWTKDIFLQDEKIECSILITISEKLSSDEYKGSIQVQSRRPIYKSSYNSPLLNYNDDDFQFHYLEFQAIEWNETGFVSNLSSMLSFYAYMVIGYDYDSFSLYGGTPYFQKAQTIVNFSQNAVEKGWRAYEDSKNRYWLVENVLNAAFSPMRECIYSYHRKGLDVMFNDREGGRRTIVESLDLLKKVHQSKPLSYNMQVFFYGKADELINIFSQGFPDEKSKVLVVLNEIDPGNANKYQKIQQ
jgi:hypothetical protein